MEEKFRKNKFDLEDMLVQLDQMRNMGSLQQIVSMLPGGIGNKLSGADLDDRQMDQVRAIICSMTPEERAKPKLINPGRKRRIAAGSGTRVEDVNRLLKQFETMSKLMKQFSRPGKRRRMMPFM